MLECDSTAQASSLFDILVEDVKVTALFDGGGLPEFSFMRRSVRDRLSNATPASDVPRQIRGVGGNVSFISEYLDAPITMVGVLLMDATSAPLRFGVFEDASIPFDLVINEPHLSALGATLDHKNRKVRLDIGSSTCRCSRRALLLL